MLNEQLKRQEEAIRWLVRHREGASAEEWEAFTSWLEQNPANAAAYDEAALADSELHELPHPTASPSRQSDRLPLLTRRRFGFAAAAAALVGIVGFSSLPQQSELYQVATAAGERRTLTLPDGSQVALNGATSLELDPSRPRFARLASGEAAFTVVHDDAAPFEVEAGGVRLRDMGTIFNVVADAGRLEVGVAEGAVLYDPGGQGIDLEPGMVLRRERSGGLQIARARADEITGWKEGRLSYSAAPLSRIADDLGRNLGVPVMASAQSEGLVFSGTLHIDRDAESTMRRVEGLLGLPARRVQGGWLIGESIDAH